MRLRRSDDETRQLMTGGAGTLAAGLLAAALTITVFGGVDHNGAHSDPGWILLLVAFGCLLCGFIAVALGAVRWLKNRRMSARWAGTPGAFGLPGAALSFRPGRTLRPGARRNGKQHVSRRGKSLLFFSEHARERRTHGKERQ